MTTEWTEVIDPVFLFQAKNEGWEIECRGTAGSWCSWNELSWHKDLDYRARLKQPKMKKVKSLCWRNSWSGALKWSQPNDCHAEGWQRFTAGDIEGEVPDDN